MHPDSLAEQRAVPDVCAPEPQHRGRFGRWALDLPGIFATTTLEISYANANGKTVTADGARTLGRDLARSLRKLLE